VVVKVLEFKNIILTNIKKMGESMRKLYKRDFNTNNPRPETEHDLLQEWKLK